MAKLRQGLYDELKNLKVEAYRSGSTYAIKGPTWLINPKTHLDDYLDDFQKDEIGALRDYAAVPTHAMTPFFKDATILDRNALEDLQPPISEELFIADWFIPNIMFNYFFAGDLSVSGDDTGISMVHFDYFANKVVLDFSMAIHAEKGTRVDYGLIRQLIYNLRDRGFNIKKVLFDQFQSNDCINTLRTRNFNVDQVNYAESFVGCTQLHELIHTNRFVYGSFNTTFVGEAKELQIVNSKRIDHLKTDGYYNSKDVWDSVVNATLGCMNDYYENGVEAQNTKANAVIADKLLASKGLTSTDTEDISWLLD